MNRIMAGMLMLVTIMMFAGNARAQLIVSDPGNTGLSTQNLIQNTAQAVSAAATAADVLAMLSMMTAAATISNLNGRQDYPAQTQLNNQLFDARTPGSTTASTIALDEDRAVSETGSSDSSGRLLEEQILGSANYAGIASDKLAELENRRPDGPMVLPNVKSALDEIARKTAETTIAVEQNTKATLLVALGVAQLSDESKTQAAALRRERAKTALMFATP